MNVTLTEKLQRAGVSCGALAAWCRCCKDGREVRCEKCILDGPERCDAQVIEALVVRILEARGQTDTALAMTKYWQGLASRLCDAVMK